MITMFNHHSWFKCRYENVRGKTCSMSNVPGKKCRYASNDQVFICQKNCLEKWNTESVGDVI